MHKNVRMLAALQLAVKVFLYQIPLKHHLAHWSITSICCPMHLRLACHVSFSWQYAAGCNVGAPVTEKRFLAPHPTLSLAISASFLKSSLGCGSQNGASNMVCFHSLSPITWKSLRLFSTGDIMAFNILGKPVLVINTAEEAYEFMEKRGSIYSDRVDSVLHSEM